jgi:predicted DNA-binding transcriptional regulator YafY
MSDLKEKLKRQTEILGLCLDAPTQIQRVDLELYFDRDKPTITRDFTSLRSGGIDIHSTKKGVRVSTPINDQLLIELILQYIGLSYSAFSYDKATALLVKRLKERALTTIVMLQRCIDEGTLASLNYEKEPGTIECDKVIAPLLLYQSENEWRLLAINDGKQKQYLLSKIRKIIPTETRFKKPAIESLRNRFETSWNSWLSGDKYQVKLRFGREAMRRYGQKQYVENQTMSDLKDGSFLFEVSVNSLNEISGWIVSRGVPIEVIEPLALREMVIKLAKTVIATHRKKTPLKQKH